MKAEPTRAWQPLTFGGVACYGQDWVGRLFATCFIFSLIVAASVLWTARRTWAPVIDEAIARLPAGAEIRDGHLQAQLPMRLAENRFLSIQLEPRGDIAPRGSSDLQVTLSRSELQFSSLFGRSSIPYQPYWTLVLSRAEMDPWWNAWRPAVLGYLAGGTIVFLFASWIFLGFVNGLMVLVVAHMANRQVSLWSSWKVAVAALMPGALFLSFALVLYSLGSLNLPELIAAFALHFFVGWIFALLAVIWLPKPADNPFEPETSDEALEKNEEEPPNPFAPKSKK